MLERLRNWIERMVCIISEPKPEPEPEIVLTWQEEIEGINRRLDRLSATYERLRDELRTNNELVIKMFQRVNGAEKAFRISRVKEVNDEIEWKTEGIKRGWL